MNKYRNKIFNVCGILSIILMLGAIMGLMGNIETGGFSPFLIINSISILAIIFLAVSLFLKNEMLLTISLIINSLISLSSVIFGFTFQELLICLTLIFLTVNLIIKGKIKNNYFFLIIAASLSCLIVGATLIGISKNIITTIQLDDLLILNFSKWLYYFMPFVYASLYASLTILLSLLINNCSLLEKENRDIKMYIPLLIVIILILASLILSVFNPDIKKDTFSFNEIFIIIIGVLELISVLSTPIFLYITNKKWLSD